MKRILGLIAILSLISGQSITFHPINHGTFIIKYDNMTIAIDPVGGSESFKEYENIDLILVTDIHGDHMSKETLSSISKESTQIIVPKAVYDKVNMGVILNNGETKMFKGIQVEAIPMYNLTEDRLKFHSKGRGNGYVLTINKKRIYISGDTEDIPEMRSLKNIDYAFICMNLPYTMTEEQAASAILEMNPKTVIPYHYRGTNGFSDVEKFKSLVNAKNNEIQVSLLKWYD